MYCGFLYHYRYPYGLRGYVDLYHLFAPALEGPQNPTAHGPHTAPYGLPGRLVILLADRWPAAPTGVYGLQIRFYRPRYSFGLDRVGARLNNGQMVTRSNDVIR